MNIKTHKSKTTNNIKVNQLQDIRADLNTTQICHTGYIVSFR